jgi:hypothetical protein
MMKGVDPMPDYRFVTKPRLYNDPEELLEYFYQYIKNCIDEKRIPTEAGMITHCFCNRSSKNNYEGKEDYFFAFQQIYQILEDETINNQTVDSNTKNLVLKSKFKYSDKQEIDLKADNITIQLIKST